MPNRFLSLSSSALLLALGVAPLLSMGSPMEQAVAQSAPATPAAPAALTKILADVDAAASQGNLQAVMAFYAPNFAHSDGLTYATFQEALTQFWKRYPGMVYKTEINSWKNDGSALVVETTTTITGTQQTADRPVNLSATIASRQRFEDQKIVKQEILSERSQVSIGQAPPTVEVTLPERVTVGNNFNFDAVVMEPLGDRVLLGAALAEPIAASGYLNTVPIDLELLSSGGLFKTGRAALIPENRWISAVVIRNDGITAVTQRMQIVGRGN